jgi:NitT/TauT family transport system ATP-binding protein
MASPAPAVEISGVTLRYYTPDKEVVAVDNVNLEVRKGEFIAIVGSSGCGKSTLLSMIAGLTLPTLGKVFVEGKAVTAPSPKVGYMFQRDTLLEWRTIKRNVLLGAEQLGLDRKASEQRAETLLKRYGLGEFMDNLPSHLSGGMRQRAALARTLCTDPDILLLDEPFSALDFQTRLSLSDEIVEILRQAGKTAILVTHDIGEAVSMAERVVVMSRRPGRIKAVHTITYPSFPGGRPTPFQARSCPEFNGYFATIWDELDVHNAH